MLELHRNNMMKEPGDFNQIFQMSGAVQLSKKRTVHVEHRTVGTLVVPSGAIVACDPATGGEPFVERVDSGQYPVILTLVTENDDARVSYARLVFGDELPTSWKLATWPEKKRGWFNRGQPTGYGVDSAMACFMDEQAERMLRRNDGMERPEYLSNVLVMNDEQTYDWGSAVLDDETGLNVIVFSSGLGDGYYSSYWGYSAQGEIVALVTDFDVYDHE